VSIGGALPIGRSGQVSEIKLDGSTLRRLPDLSKSPSRIAGMFDAIAYRYDFLNRLLSAGIDRRWRARAVAALRLTGRERVLDLCTGTADLAIAARTARPPAGRVIGVDFAGAMLRIGLEKLHRRGLAGSVHLVRGDAARIPLADGSVDAVTIAFGIRNVESTAVVCAEIARVLSRGGRLAILEFSTPSAPLVRPLYLWYFNRVLPRIGRFFSRSATAYEYLPTSVRAFASPAQFAELLGRAGFVDLRAQRLTGGIVYLYTARRARDPGTPGPDILR
jgi:demethylmenaquinone methyltransferase/2-methoxy-6-polyprenyl-1,4-benzoquinol methylase